MLAPFFQPRKRTHEISFRGYSCQDCERKANKGQHPKRKKGSTITRLQCPLRDRRNPHLHDDVFAACPGYSFSAQHGCRRDQNALCRTHPVQHRSLSSHSLLQACMLPPRPMRDFQKILEGGSATPTSIASSHCTDAALHTDGQAGVAACEASSYVMGRENHRQKQDLDMVGHSFRPNPQPHGQVQELCAKEAADVHVTMFSKTSYTRPRWRKPQR